MPSALDLDLLGKIIGEKIKEKLRSEVTSGDVNVQELTNTILKATRDYVKALIDDSIKGVFRSLGDAGPSPINYTGKTALKLLNDVYNYCYGIWILFFYPTSAETYTTTPLGANAVYYSPSKDFQYGRLGHAGAIGIADQPSATDGVYAQLSIDGLNWDYIGVKTTAQANVGVALLSQEVAARYLRFVWTNGATAQTVFRFGGRYYI
jgi:hypothetical protein